MDLSIYIKDHNLIRRRSQIKRKLEVIKYEKHTKLQSIIVNNIANKISRRPD